MMTQQLLAWTSCATIAAIVTLASLMTVHVGAVQANTPQYPGQGSHNHMRKHQHGTGHNHRHHTPPKRPPPASATERQDPKRMPREEWTNKELLKDNDLFHDREHLKEELPEYLNLEKVEEMSDKELDFHYFRMHDFDNNLLLDGLELLAALGHVAEEDEEEEGGEGDEAGGGKAAEEKKKLEDDLKGLSEEEKKVVRHYRYQKWEDDWKFYIDLVDGVLEHNDLNRDGYLSWSEFLKGRRRNI